MESLCLGKYCTGKVRRICGVFKASNDIVCVKEMCYELSSQLTQQCPRARSVYVSFVSTNLNKLLTIF